MKRPLQKALRSALGGFFLMLLALQGQSQQILDLLSTSPTVAYSLRQLKSTATKAIQVRRSSDNATLDISFTAGGDLDQVALLSFVGGNSGYITIWYDQSGNGHDALQATVAKQPRIVNAGVIDAQNGRPIVDFNGTTSTMATANFGLTTPISVFLVNRRTGTGTSSTGYVTMFDGANNNTYKVAYPNTSNPTSMGVSPMDWSGGTTLQPVPQLNSNSLFMYSALCDATSGVQYLNGGIQSHNFPGAGANLNGIRLFRGSPLPADNELPAGQLSECIVFGSKISNADRQMLDCSESNYYSIQVIPAGLEFYVTSGISANACAQAKEDVAWQAGSLNNVQATGSTLTKYQSNAWDGGAASWNTVGNNGFVQFTASETNKSRMLGLSNTFTSNSYITIQYAWFLTNGGSLQIYESGNYRGSFGTFTTGDILKISAEGGLIKYYKNGVLQYISGSSPTLPLLVDVSIADNGGTITGATVTNFSTGVFTATALNAGSSPGYQWYLNGSPVGTNTNTYTNTSLNNNDVVNCVLTPNITGCGALTIASNNVKESVTASPNVDFAIQGTAAASGCNSVLEQVEWMTSTLTTGMSASTNNLSKFQINGWNGGAASWNTVSNNGYFQFTASETNKNRMAGLSNAYTSSSYSTIQYAFYLTNGGSLQIYESGSGRGGFGTYVTGDILKISVDNGIVKYYKNGTLLYISQVAPTLPLLVNASLNDAGGTITNALVSNYNAGVFTASTANAGTNPTYQWLLNGTPVGTNSSTYTNTSLNNNDVVTCMLTPGLQGCSSVPLTSNSITETMVPPVSADFSITGVTATTNCNTMVEQVKWKLSDLSNYLIPAGNSLSKFQNGGWNTGTSAWNTVSNNGYFQFTATETNKNRMAGLSATYTGPSYTNIQYAFYLVSGGNLQIYESGNGRGSFGTYVTGDILKISVESNVVKYYKNGTLLYISQVAPTLPMLVDAALNDVGSTIGNALVSNYNAGTFMANTANAGSSPTFNWMVNGVSVQNSTSATYTNTSLNSSDVVTCQMTPSLPGCTAITLSSNSITDTVVAPINVDFSIQGVAAASSCSSVIEQVKWDLANTTNNMTVVGTNSLSKFQSSNWDGGAGSWNTVSNNGYFQFTATETNTARMAGLSTSYGGSNYTTIQYAFYLTSSGSLQIYESGSYKGSFGNYATGDILKISVEASTVKYYKNGVLLYISNVAPTLPMIVDVSMYHPGSTISNALVYNYSGGSFIANTTNAGVNPTFNWMVNGVSVQNSTSATYTNTSLNNGDVVTCQMTPNLTGCVTSTVNSNSITDTVVAPFGMDFAIQGTPATTNCSAITEQVKWKIADLNNNLTLTSTGLSRFQNSNWNAGDDSWNTVSNNGYFQFTASETNTYRAIGLSNSFTGNNYTNIQYCFYLNSGGTLSIYESGSGRGNYGSYNPGDILKISVESNVVKYYKNGVLLYISTVTPTLPMLVDASIFSVNGTITNATVTNYSAGTFTASSVNAGASPTFNWMVNGVSVQNSTSATYTNTSLNNNDVVTCLMTPNLSGCTSVPVASNTLTDTVIAPANLDFSIVGTAATSNCNTAIEQVKWKLSDLSTYLVITGVNGLSKFQNGGWNTGDDSWNTVSNNGYFQFTATETNKNRMAGLSNTYSGPGYSTIQYAFYLAAGGSLQIYESGSGRGTFGTYTTGDILKISVENNVVKYYKNGTLLYISNVAPTLPLLVDAALNDVGSTIGGAVVSNYNAGVFTANTANAGASPNFNWMVNGVSVQNGTSATYTNTSLNNGDIVTCVLTPNLAGCNATTTYTSNTITDSVAAPVNLDFAIVGTPSAANCTSVIEQVKWKLSDLNTNLVASTNNISRFQNSGWNAGDDSWNSVSNNGYFQFTASETSTDRMAGLSTTFAGNSYTTIQYAFHLKPGGALEIWESGNYRNTFGTYTTGDILKITVESNVVKYYKNGTLLYISTVVPVLPMVVDVSINSTGGTITNALVSNYNAGVFTANTANAGASPNFNWMVNGASVQNGTSATYTNASLNNNDVVTCVMTPNLSGCNATTTYTSNSITNTTVPPLNVDFAITGTAATSNCTSVIEQVKWNLSNVTPNMTVVSVNSLSKFQSNGVWDGGAASWNTVSNNGYFQFTATENTTNREAGLSASYTGPGNNLIQYAFYLVAGGNLQITESGSNKGTFGTYTPGDILKISVESNVVKYYKNGTLLYISGLAPTLPMLVDVSIRDVGATISNAQVSNYSTGTFTANTTNAGATPTFQWMVNGIIVQTSTSATYTNTSLNNGDVVTCVMTPNLPGCSATTYNSNTITNTTTPPLGLDFSIQGVVDPSSCAAVVEQVEWKLSNLSANMNVVSVNGLSKFQSNNWDGGAASWNSVSNNGYFQFTASETTTNRMAGLSNTFTSSSYTTIQYAFYLVAGGSLHIYESGSDKGAFGTYTTGDILKISVENNVVKYYRNGTLLRTSGTAPTLPMLVDVSVQNVGGTITAAFVSNLNSGSFVANAVNAGSFPNYKWMVNGATVQTGLSASYTNAALNNSDIVTCTLTPNLPGCSASTYNSNTVTYAKSGSTTTWTGTTSTNWFTASNWSAGLPDRFTSAVIASGTPNNPTLSSDASVYDLTINSGATLTITGSPILYIYRNFTNNGTFVPATGTVDFVSCSSPAVISSTGTETFYNLMINTPYGVTISSGTQQVSKLMTFVTGIVTQNTTLTILNGAGVSGATDASHVNGVVTKVGTGAFTFPVGDATQYRPIAISSPASATDVFTAQYIRSNPGPAGYPQSQRDPTLADISSREYWMLNRVNGVSNVTVNLSWNTQSGTIVNMGGMHVTGWSTAASKWKDLGSSGTTGNASGGTVTSAAAVTTFGAFTLATLTANNVLPIQLLYFHADKVNPSLIDLSWATSSEQNSSYFIVERSADGLQFGPIQTLPAAGNSSLTLNYTTKDSHPLKGVSYYRLKMTDLDGSSIYSDIRVINTGDNMNLTLYPNPAAYTAYIGLNDNKALKVAVVDMTGRELVTILRPTDPVLPVDVSRLAEGMYFIIIDLDDKTRVTKKLLIKR